MKNNSVKLHTIIIDHSGPSEVFQNGRYSLRVLFLTGMGFKLMKIPTL